MSVVPSLVGKAEIKAFMAYSEFVMITFSWLIFCSLMFLRRKRFFAVGCDLVRDHPKDTSPPLNRPLLSCNNRESPRGGWAAGRIGGTRGERYSTWDQQINGSDCQISGALEEDESWPNYCRWFRFALVLPHLVLVERPSCSPPGRKQICRHRAVIRNL